MILPSTPLPGTLLLCVVHPSAAVRGLVVAAAPGWVEVTAAADARDLAPVGGADVVVVAVDPARTSPDHVVAVLGGRPHVLSISNLQLDVADPAVDSTLPLRRLNEHTLGRHLRGLLATDLPVSGLS